MQTHDHQISVPVDIFCPISNELEFAECRRAKKI